MFQGDSLTSRLISDIRSTLSRQTQRNEKLQSCPLSIYEEVDQTTIQNCRNKLEVYQQEFQSKFIEENGEINGPDPYKSSIQICYNIQDKKVQLEISGISSSLMAKIAQAIEIGQEQRNC